MNLSPTSAANRNKLWQCYNLVGKKALNENYIRYHPSLVTTDANLPVLLLRHVKEMFLHGALFSPV